MLTAGGEADGRRFVLIGLSHRNLDLLREGLPIKLDLAEMGLGEGLQDIVIMAGKNEDTIQTDLRGAGIDLPPGNRL